MQKTTTTTRAQLAQRPPKPCQERRMALEFNAYGLVYPSRESLHTFAIPSLARDVNDDDDDDEAGNQKEKLIINATYQDFEVFVPSCFLGSSLFFPPRQLQQQQLQWPTKLLTYYLNYSHTMGALLARSWSCCCCCRHGVNWVNLQEIENNFFLYSYSNKINLYS